MQPHPCNGATTNLNKKEIQEINNIVSSAEAKIWPNPSNNYFTLRPANSANNESVQLKVFNVNGQQVYTATGSSGKDYRFGERLTPGIYMVEFIQGNNRTTFKLVKQ